MTVRVQLIRPSGLISGHRLAREGDFLDLPVSEAKELLQRKDGILSIRMKVLREFLLIDRWLVEGDVVDCHPDHAKYFQDRGHVVLCRLRVTSQSVMFHGQPCEKGKTLEVPLKDLVYSFEQGLCEWADEVSSFPRKEGKEGEESSPGGFPMVGAREASDGLPGPFRGESTVGARRRFQISSATGKS